MKKKSCAPSPPRRSRSFPPWGMKSIIPSPILWLTCVPQPPRLRWQRLGTHLHTLQHRLDTAMRSRLTLHREQLNGLGSTLHSLSPLAVLGRGYSICRDPVTQRLATSTASVHPGQQVEVLLSDGDLTCTVNTIQQR